jgi:catechol 2,3-dioxygenase-like lactoylglutathione lyase family enzyme
MSDARSKALSIRAFIPARDMDTSRAFYQDLGFEQIWGDDSACGMKIDDCGIILQRFYVKEHAGNFMMALSVDDLDAWWRHIQALGLEEKYGLHMVKAPAMQPWGIRVLYISDPTGVLWHIAEYSKA